MKKDKGYHGYLILPRQSKLLLRELGHGLFGFYLELVMNAGWYRGNKNFGRISKIQAELAIKLNMEQSTVSRNLTALQNRNKYCVIKHKNYLVLGFFPLFVKDVVSEIHSKDYAGLNELYADMHKINAEMQGKYAFSQDKRTKNDGQSFKGSSNEDPSCGGSSGSGDTGDTGGIGDAADSENIDIDEVDEGIERMKKERE